MDRFIRYILWTARGGRRAFLHDRVHDHDVVLQGCLMYFPCQGLQFRADGGVDRYVRGLDGEGGHLLPAFPEREMAA